MTAEFAQRLVKLRDHVASLYGEDLAQDIVIRMILNPSLNDLQVLTKAKWLFRSELKRERWFVPIADEQIEFYLGFDDFDRVNAWIELRRLCKKSARVVKIVKVELGLYVVSRQRESFVRAVNREEGESL